MMSNSNNNTNGRRRELPPQFAQSIIEFEMAVDRPDAKAEHIQKLMDLYTVSLESFLSKIFSIR